MNKIKRTATQIINTIAGVFLICTIIAQAVNNAFLAERFAVLFYFWLIAATLSALTDPYHQPLLHIITSWNKRIQKLIGQKHYRWTYVCYFIFVFILLQKYGFTDGVASLTLIMGWLMINFSGYYFFILTILYLLIIPYLGETSTTDVQYGLVYFVCGIITILLTSKKFFK